MEQCGKSCQQDVDVVGGEGALPRSDLGSLARILFDASWLK